MLRVVNRPPVDYSKCNQTVTIYHASTTAGVTTYSKKVITKAFYDFRKNQNINKTGSVETNSFLLVIPATESATQPAFVGDKVLLGTGADVTTREAWASLIPSTTAGLTVVKYVDPKYWNNKVAHWEIGG